MAKRQDVEVFDVIAARSFVVPDRSGAPRIVLGLDEDEGESPYIRLLRPDGSPSATMHSDADGNVMLALIDAEGGWRLSVRLTGEGAPDISLFDADLEQPRLTLMVEPDIDDGHGGKFSGRTSVQINGRDQEAHAQLFVTNENDGDLVLLNGLGGGNSYGPPRGAKPGSRA